MTEPDPLVSDADRDRVALQLRDAAADGRLTLEELTDRLDRTFAARTAGALDTLTRDLTAARALAPTPSQGTRRRVSAILSGADVKGRLRIDGTLAVKAVLGGVQLDLTQAELVGGEATIDLSVVMGGVEIVVPPGVEVETHDLSTIMGGQSVQVPTAPPHAPVVRLTGRVVLGGVDVKVRGDSGLITSRSGARPS